MQIPGYVMGFIGLFMFCAVVVFDAVIDTIEYNKFSKKRTVKKNIV